MDGVRRLESRINNINFNGAMAVRPWMGSGSRTRKALATYFNGAMAVRPWMARARATAPIPRANFNGAMAVRPWMAVPHLEPVGLAVTSMGPWP